MCLIFRTEHEEDEDGTTDKSIHDIVILFSAGLGLPSALSALRQFIELRRHKADLVPPYVWFVWATTNEDDLRLACERARASHHNLIYRGVM